MNKGDRVAITASLACILNLPTAALIAYVGGGLTVFLAHLVVFGFSLGVFWRLTDLERK